VKPRNQHRDTSICANLGCRTDELRTVDGRRVRICGSVREEGRRMDAKRVLTMLKRLKKSLTGTCEYCGANLVEGPECGNECALTALIAEAEQEAQDGGWKPTGLAVKLREKAAEWYAKNSGVGYHVGRAYECAAGMVETEEVGGWKPGTEPPPEDIQVLIVFDRSRLGMRPIYHVGCVRMGHWEFIDGQRIDFPFTGWCDLPPLPKESEVKP